MLKPCPSFHLLWGGFPHPPQSLEADLPASGSFLSSALVSPAEVLLIAHAGALEQCVVIICLDVWITETDTTLI